jgi:hypothetical protein
MESKDWKSLISSLFVCAVVTIMMSPVITQAVVQPLIIESRLVTFGRYAFASEAIDSIAEDDSLSVVGIGSSMMYKAFDGDCMEALSEVENSKFYNLGVPASRPYTDMMQIPRLSNSGVDVVLVEVGANLLFKMSEGPNDYLEFRFTVQTMIQENSDLGPWTEIVLPYHQKWVYANEYERTAARQEWFVESNEILLERLFGLEQEDDIEFRFLPDPETPEWVDYLKRPGWPASVIENDWKRKMTMEEYNETYLMTRSKFEPLGNGTQNHAALHYIISELIQSDIEVVLVGMPHHPHTYPYLDDGQWDGYNTTLQTLSESYDVNMMDFTWAEKDGWAHKHFSDKNHLDDDGRLEFCERMTPLLNSLLES